MAKILLVEDHEINRDMLMRRLERRNYHVLEAGSGEEALAIIETEIPDLVLMDLNLPGIDGWETTRRMKGSPRTAHVPVIGLSAHILPEIRSRGLEAGCEDYETKPIDFPRLLAKMQQALKEGCSNTQA